MLDIYLTPNSYTYSRVIKPGVQFFREIQQSLVEIGDKDPSFIGSREWIGAIELSFVLDKLLGVSVPLFQLLVKFELLLQYYGLHMDEDGFLGLAQLYMASI